MVTLEDVFNKLRSILRNRFRVALLDETKTATLSGGLIQTLQLRNHQEKSNTAFFTPQVTEVYNCFPKGHKTKTANADQEMKSTITDGNFNHKFHALI